MFLLAAIRNIGTYVSLAMEVSLPEYMVKNDKTTSKESEHIQWNRSIDKYHNTSTSQVFRSSFHELWIFELV